MRQSRFVLDCICWRAQGQGLDASENRSRQFGCAFMSCFVSGPLDPGYWLTTPPDIVTLLMSCRRPFPQKRQCRIWYETPGAIHVVQIISGERRLPPRCP